MTTTNKSIKARSLVTGRMITLTPAADKVDAQIDALLSSIAKGGK